MQIHNQVKIHITRIPHKKFENLVFDIYLNDERSGSLRQSESLTLETTSGPVKLSAVVNEKSYIKSLILSPGADHFNLEINEPKWHLFLKYGLSMAGLLSVVVALVSKPIDLTVLLLGGFCFLAFLDKREEPEWVEVKVI